MDTASINVNLKIHSIFAIRKLVNLSEIERQRAHFAGRLQIITNTCINIVQGLAKYCE